jgi:hypothetical protein
VIVQQHHKPRRGERLSEGLQTVVTHPGEADGHGDRRVWTAPLRDEQPATQRHRILGGELDIPSLHCRQSLTVERGKLYSLRAFHSTILWASSSGTSAITFSRILRVCGHWLSECG